MRVTAKMREALELARKQPLRRVLDDKPGAAPWPAPWQTLRALEKQDLLRRDVIRNKHGWPTEIWDLTEAGRLVLDPPPRFREDRDEYLAWTGRGSDWTRDPSRRADDAARMPEASPQWRRRAEAARLGAQDRRDLARRVARQAKAA